MARSEKRFVIERLFDKRWDEGAKTIRDPMVTLDEVADEIRACKKAGLTKLSAKNPSNFFKDLLRPIDASKNWPESVSKRRFTAVQVTQDGFCFKFVPYKVGQTEPLPLLYAPSEDTPNWKIQSLSIPLASKDLGRLDETWLMKAIIDLHLVETYFSVFSKADFVEIFHLQNNIKLRKTETDAVYRGSVSRGRDVSSIFITCEAKQKDRLIKEQIINQAREALSLKSVDAVVPIGIQNLKKRGIYLAEFNTITSENDLSEDRFRVVGDALFEIVPSLKGVN